jgi:hypothetical protein
VQVHGHEVRLVRFRATNVPPGIRSTLEPYGKPSVKRRKNDRADVEAVAEAALRPTMRVVAVRSAQTQVCEVAFRTDRCLLRQRTQLINTLRRGGTWPKAGSWRRRNRRA